MPQKTALVDYNKCRPKHCNKGICAAALVCPHQLLKQEAPYERPMSSLYPCQNCAKCVLACPLKAMVLM